MSSFGSIAVIIPIYNGEKYLSDCFDSILNQTYQNFTLYLMNDGSKDNSHHICQSYEKNYPKRIKYSLLPNGGANLARKIALDDSHEDFVFFIDQDDYLADKNVLGRLIDEFNQDRECELIVFKYAEYFEKTNVIKKRRDYILPKNTDSVSQWLKVFVKNSTIPLSPWDKIFKRSFLINNGIHLSTKYIASDINWFIDILTCVKKIRVINEVMYIYRRQVDTSMTTQKFNIKKFDDLLSIIEDECVKIKSVNNGVEYSIKSFLAYEYCILLAMTSNLNRDELNYYFPRLDPLKVLLQYRENYKVSIAYVFIKLLGLRHTAKLMRWYIQKFVNRM